MEPETGPTTDQLAQYCWVPSCYSRVQTNPRKQRQVVHAKKASLNEPHFVLTLHTGTSWYRAEARSSTASLVGDCHSCYLSPSFIKLSRRPWSLINIGHGLTTSKEIPMVNHWLPMSNRHFTNITRWCYSGFPTWLLCIGSRGSWTAQIVHQEWFILVKKHSFIYVRVNISREELYRNPYVKTYEHTYMFDNGSLVMDSNGKKGLIIV